MRIAVVTMVALAGCSSGEGSIFDAGAVADAGSTAADAGAPGGAGDAGSGGVTDGGGSVAGLFEHEHPWTKDVSMISVSSESNEIISTLAAMDGGGWGGKFHRFQFDDSIHVLNAEAGATRATVIPAAGYYVDDCATLPATIPLPAVGATEGEASYACTMGGDCHLLIISKSEKKVYELYQANMTASGLAAACLVVWDLTKQYPDTLRGEQCTSVDAAGLPVSAFMVSADEVKSGSVNHALRFILPNDHMQRKVYVRPATHAGAPSNVNPHAPPYGVRFRLKASFNEASLPTEGARVIARALKKYGMVLSDGGEIPVTIQSDRFTATKWADVGVTNTSLAALKVTDFEVVDLGARIALTYACVLNP